MYIIYIYIYIHVFSMLKAPFTTSPLAGAPAMMGSLSCAMISCHFQGPVPGTYVCFWARCREPEGLFCELC